MCTDIGLQADDLLATSCFSFSMSSPFLPMTMPGRAVWIVTRADLAGRSIWMRDTEACASFFLQELAHRDVLDQVLAVGAALGVPVRRPLRGDAEAETVGIDFMAHEFDVLSLALAVADANLT